MKHPMDVDNGWLFSLYVAAIALAIGVPLAAIIIEINHAV